MLNFLEQQLTALPYVDESAYNFEKLIALAIAKKNRGFFRSGSQNYVIILSHSVIVIVLRSFDLKAIVDRYPIVKKRSPITHA